MSTKLYLKSNEGTANGGVATDVTFDISPLTTNQYFNFTITLESAEIPVSFYNINSSNKTFKHQLQSGGTITDLTIPPKNYTADQLTTTLNSIMSALNVSVVYNSQTNKFTFTGTAPFKLQPIGDNYRVLGIHPTNFTLSTVNVLESPNMINLLYPRNCFVKLVSTQDTTYDKTLAKVQLSAQEYQIVYFSGTVASEFSITLRDDLINELRISLVNDDDTRLGGNQGLNNIDWSIGVNIERVPV